MRVHTCDTLDWPGANASVPAGIESACNAGDPGSIPGSGRSPGERIEVKASASNAGDLVSIPG